jgi:cytochrome c553
MRRFAVAIVGGLSLVASGVVVAQQGAAAGGTGSTAPASMNWAYAIPPAPAGGAPAAGARAGGAAPAAAPAAEQPTIQLPGSTLRFTLAQVRDGFGPADWFPGDHPQMPEVVAKGRRPDVRACSLCHMPNGKGRPENAGVAGLPTEYFLKTLEDFRTDHRKSTESRKGNTGIMAVIAKGMTPEEMKQAAEYFGSMKWTPWITVKESNTVPVTRSQGGMWIPVEPAATEPIGMRVMEMPENVEHTEQFRDPRSGFVAYVPMGSIKKGETLVRTGGNGKTIACGNCHGPELQGMGPVPGLAGRSPSYLARQMYDMKTGARHGTWSELMKPVVAKLTDEDFVNIVAYVASRPAAAGTTATR